MSIIDNSDYGSKSYISRPASIAVSRFKILIGLNGGLSAGGGREDDLADVGVGDVARGKDAGRSGLDIPFAVKIELADEELSVGEVAVGEEDRFTVEVGAIFEKKLGHPVRPKVANSLDAIATDDRHLAGPLGEKARLVARFFSLA